jgi:signal transduction histidine kinase/PAS domain-containing protein
MSIQDHNYATVPIESLDLHADRPSTPNPAFEDLAYLASSICQTPIASIGTYRDTEARPNGELPLQIIAAVGLDSDRERACLELCRRMMEQPQRSVLEQNLSEFPVAGGDRPWGGSAGVPIVDDAGRVFGAIVAIDYTPCNLSAQQQDALLRLSQQALAQIELQRLRRPHADGRSRQTPSLHSHSGRSTAFPACRLTQPNLASIPPSRASDRALQTALLDRVTDAITLLDRAGRISEANEPAARLWNCHLGQLLGRSASQLLSAPDARASFDRHCQQALDRQTPLTFELFEPSLVVTVQVRVYPDSDGLSIYWRKLGESTQPQSVLLSGLVAEVGAAIARSNALDVTLNSCAEILERHLGAIAISIWTVDPDGSLPIDANGAGESLILELQAQAGDFSDDPHRQLVETVARDRQPQCDRLIPGESTPDSYLCGYPLILEERLVGAIAVQTAAPMSSMAQATLSCLAGSFTLAIDRWQARRALLVRREGLLFRLASQIRKSLDLDTILDTAVHEIRNCLHIDRCHYLWYWPNPKFPSMAVTHEARQAQLPSLLGDCRPEQIDPLAEKIQSLETIQIDNLHASPDVDEQMRWLMEGSEAISQLLLPLSTRSGQFGAIVCSHCRGPRPWSEAEVELLQAVVDQLAIAIDQAELYAETRAAALAAQTQAKQLSEALHNLKQTEAQLIQNEKMSSLGQMVAGIAHEINNPVNFITGNLSHAETYIQELLELIDVYQDSYPQPVAAVQTEIEDIDLEFLVEDLPKLLSSMKMGAERIRQIVLSLRNFSRLDEAEMKPVNIHDGIENTLLILQGRLKGNGDRGGIELIKEYGDLPKVECYAGLLNQVFMNILANAIDALEGQPDPRTITIETETVEAAAQPALPHAQKPTDSVLIRIRDNGAGIREEVQKRLFDPFFTTKPVGKGTGLGLSISYQIVVEKHGGNLECRSELGKGSEFSLRIPIRQPAMRR